MHRHKDVNLKSSELNISLFYTEKWVVSKYSGQFSLCERFPLGFMEEICNQILLPVHAVHWGSWKRSAIRYCYRCMQSTEVHGRDLQSDTATGACSPLGFMEEIYNQILRPVHAVHRGLWKRSAIRYCGRCMQSALANTHLNDMLT